MAVFVAADGNCTELVCHITHYSEQHVVAALLLVHFNAFVDNFNTLQCFVTDSE
jgi:hypothetical protein